MPKLGRFFAAGLFCAGLGAIPENGARAEGPHQDVSPTRVTQTAQRTVEERDCRQFQQTIVIADQEVIAYGVACRQPDGQWEVQSIGDYVPVEQQRRAQDPDEPSASEVSISTTGGLSAQGLQYDSGAGGMAFDGFFVRPISLVGTIVGSMIFVLTLPFSAISGNAAEAADTLVMEPARFTFTRCLGCWPKRF